MILGCGEHSEEQNVRRELGERITSLRERLRWTQTGLALELGVGRARLGKWEAGEHAPPLSKLILLSRVLGVSTDELLTGEESGPLPGLGDPEGIERAIWMLRRCLRWTRRELERN
ncbi:MAG: helix-turn-helix domain-containing protein [Thermoanaerobaculia bacterium]